MISHLLSLLLASTSFASELQYLHRPDQAISAYVQSIQGARKSVDLDYYEFSPCDSIAKIFVKLLAQKKSEDPNFRIRLIVDGTNGNRKLKTAFSDRLSALGIEVRYFNESFSPLYNFRTHSKMMIIDGDLSSGKLIMGGRNISDPHFGISVDRRNYVDRDVLVSGADVKIAQTFFEQAWNSDFLSVLGTGSPDENSVECMNWNDRDESIYQNVLLFQQRRLLGIPVFDCADTKFSADSGDHIRASQVDWNAPDGLNSELDRVASELLQKKATTKNMIQLFSGAEDSLSIESYLLIPDGQVGDLLRKKIKDGLDVRIITNLFTNGEELVQPVHNHYVIKQWPENLVIYPVSFMEHPSQTWEMSEQRVQDVHAKTYVVDKRDAAITSFNLDPRSYHTNLESGYFVYNCPSFASYVSDQSSKLLADLRAEDLEKVVLRRDGVDDRDAETPFFQSMLTWLFRNLL